MNDRDERWAAVGTKVVARMAELGMNQKDVVTASGISAETVRPIRQGVPGNYSAKTKSKVSMALRWRSDGIDRILDGHEPVEVTTTAGIDQEPIVAELQLLRDEIAQLRAEIRDQ